MPSKVFWVILLSSTLLFLLIGPAALGKIVPQLHFQYSSSEVRFDWMLWGTIIGLSVASNVENARRRRQKALREQ